MWAVLNNYHYSIHFCNTFKWISFGIFLVFIKVAASRYVCMFTKPYRCEISCTLLPYPIYISMFVRKHTHTLICMQTHIHTGMHMNICTHIHTHIFIRTYIYSHNLIQAYTHRLTNKPIYTYIMNPYMHFYNTYT